jgi:hypothetical protein
MYRRDAANSLLIKLDPASQHCHALAKMESVFKELNPASTLEYSFVDDAFNQKFASEEEWVNSHSVFAVWPFSLVAWDCLGLHLSWRSNGQGKWYKKSTRCISGKRMDIGKQRFFEACRIVFDHRRAHCLFFSWRTGFATMNIAQPYRGGSLSRQDLAPS